MSRRVALISEVASYVGPDLARLLAQRGHDLVVGVTPIRYLSRS